MKPKVLAIIVTYNGAKWIKDAIESLRNSTLSNDILVIDNGSTDGTLEILEQLEVETIRTDENLGFGAANNIGMSLALERQYKFAYLMNQDAHVDKKCLGKLVKAIKDYPEFGIVSPMQYDGSGEKMDFQFRKRCNKYLKRADTDADVVQVPFVMAAHWMISRSCMVQVGCFCPMFKLYGEDDNFIDRAHFHGLRVGVVPSASAVHDRAQRPNPKSRRMYLKCTSALRCALNPNWPTPLAMAVALFKLFFSGLIHFSLTPILYIPKLIRLLPEIKSFRKDV